MILIFKKLDREKLPDNVSMICECKSNRYTFGVYRYTENKVYAFGLPIDPGEFLNYYQLVPNLGTMVTQALMMSGDSLSEKLAWYLNGDKALDRLDGNLSNKIVNLHTPNYDALADN